MERRGDGCGGCGRRGGAWAIRCNRAASSQVTTGLVGTTTAILCAEGGRDDDADDDVADPRIGNSWIGGCRTGDDSRAEEGTGTGDSGRSDSWNGGGT